MRDSHRFVSGLNLAAAFALAIGLGRQAQARPTQQSASFTYQGLLKQSNAPVNGSVDLQFKLFDAASGGAQIGSTLAANAVAVVDGVFTSSLDFGALAFNGNERWIEIESHSPGSADLWR